MNVLAVVYFGLLPALLFSSGEGIRLAPFPVAPAANTESANRDRNSRRGYQKNVLRVFGSKGGSWAAKKNPQRSSLLSASFPAEAHDVLPESVSQIQAHRTPLLNSSVGASSGVCGRAPPAVPLSRAI